MLEEFNMHPLDEEFDSKDEGFKWIQRKEELDNPTEDGVDRGSW